MNTKTISASHKGRGVQKIQWPHPAPGANSEILDPVADPEDNLGWGVLDAWRAE